MENRFANAVGKQLNFTSTENGQLAYKSTAVSKVLDFYAVAGALRTRSEDDIKTKMAEAFNESPLLATRLLFYLSDIREGLGERRTFRIALEWLADNHPAVVETNLQYIAHFNRWDSLFALKGTLCEKQMVQLCARTTRRRHEGRHPRRCIHLSVGQVASFHQHLSARLASWAPGSLASLV